MSKLTGLAIFLLVVVVSFAPGATSATTPAAAAPITNMDAVTVIPFQPEAGSAYLSDGTSVLPGTERLERLTHSNVTYAGVSAAQDQKANDGQFLVVRVEDGTNGLVTMIPYVTVTIDNSDPALNAKIDAAFGLAERQGFTTRENLTLDGGILR